MLTKLTMVDEIANEGNIDEIKKIHYDEQPKEDFSALDKYRYDEKTMHINKKLG